MLREMVRILNFIVKLLTNLHYTVSFVLFKFPELESDWETIVDAQRRAKSGKLQVEAPSKEVFIITELVEFNEKKHRYIPVPYIKERQYVGCQNH